MQRDMYWSNIVEMYRKQTDKGINKYGQILEQNIQMTAEERLTYLEEELVDALMYCEHIKKFHRDYPLTAHDYQIAALRTANSFDEDDLVLNGALGLSGETGEVADHIKKFRFQGHDLDKEYLAKELGDVCWYIAILAKGIGYDLATIMEMNIDKLKKRYPNGFEVSRSLNREESK